MSTKVQESKDFKDFKQKPPGNLILRFIKALYYWLRLLYQGPPMILKEMFEKKNTLELPSRPGEVAVITGGARGFGFEVVKKLLQSGFTVIVGDVHEGELKKLLDDGRATTNNLKYFYVNLKSLKSVREFAKKVLDESNRIDLLFNNAGIMFTPYEETEDGYESQFQVNYLGHFLLTQLLLPKIKSTANKKTLCCRIVHTSSCAHYFANLDFKSPEKWKIWASNKAYYDSKYAQVLHTKYLDKIMQDENAKVRVNCVHPGMVPSRLWDNVWKPLRNYLSSLRKYYRSTEDGGNTILFAALSPNLENQGGLYLHNCVPKSPKLDTENILLQQALWDKSVELVRKGE